MKFKITKANILPLVGFPLLFAAIIMIMLIFWNQLFFIFTNSEEMKRLLSTYGLLAPLIFIGLQILQVVIFIIPGELPQVAGGYFFGTGLGILYSTIGIALGSLATFYLARFLGIPFVKLFLKEEQMAKISGLATAHRSQIIIFFVFLIPGFPFKDIMSYIVGLSPMKFYVFILISMMGRLPGIIGSALMGHAAANQNWTLLIVIFVIAAALFLAGYLLKEKILKIMKGKSKENVKGHDQNTDTQ